MGRLNQLRTADLFVALWAEPRYHQLANIIHQEESPLMPDGEDVCPARGPAASRGLCA